MAETSDARRLQAWRERRDRDAMDELIRRHIHFVYGAARRTLRDAAWAQDVTQAVFLLLIQKSPRVPNDAALSVWLHRTTLYACANARRVRLRCQQRDRRAAQGEILPMHDDIEQIDNAEERSRLLPLLDSALARLAPRDRSGVILCYFQQHSFREIGAAMGTTEEAARKRVTRAVERLREYFAARGVATASTSIVSCLASQSSVLAPPALVQATANIAGLSQLVATTSTCAQIFNGVLHTMLLSKVKVAASLAAAVLLTSAAAGLTIHQVYASNDTAALLSPAPQNAHSVTADELQVEFIGVVDITRNDPKAWFAIDGGRVDLSSARFEDAFAAADRNATKALAIKITCPDQTVPGFSVGVTNAKSSSYRDFDHGNIKFLLVSFTPNDGVIGADVELRLANGEWKELCTSEIQPERKFPRAFTTEKGGVAFTPLFANENGSATVCVAHETKDAVWRVTATDDAGAVHLEQTVMGGRAGNFSVGAVTFDVPADRIASLAFQWRPFNRAIVAKNISIDPAKPTKPTIEVSGKR